MPLVYSGETAGSIENVSHEATDQNGKRVIVRISREATEDFGDDIAHEAGSKKFDRGAVEPDGSVQVRTADCIAER